MPARLTGGRPTPIDSDATSSIPNTEKSRVTSVSARDTDYRDTLQLYNIEIEVDTPPSKLMERAREIISKARTSPEIDDATAQELVATARRIQNDGEESIVQQMAPDMIPAMHKLRDTRLASNAGQLWHLSVPVPLSLSTFEIPLHLPKPKPDLAFGYSAATFTARQRGTIGRLIKKETRVIEKGAHIIEKVTVLNYAMPDQKLRFPFLDIEFKSEAKNGTHRIGTNQIANAGAIALNGKLELMRRCCDTSVIDFDKPQFFSMTMDHEQARINVHWLSKTEEGQYKFHIEGILKRYLNDADGQRAIQRAIKNILEYGADELLPELCAALDKYQKIPDPPEAVGATTNQETTVQAEPQPESVPQPAGQGHEDGQEDVELEHIAIASVEEDEADGPEEAAPPQPAQRRSRRKPTPTQRPVQKSTSPPVRQSKRKGVTKKAPAKAQTRSLAKTMHTKQVTRAMEAVAG
jgi:hypothetical protein